MFAIAIPFIFLWITCTAEDYYYYPLNVTRSTLSAIAAYRSALTLDWLAAEDSRQRELAAAFETQSSPPSRLLATECIAYPRPSTGKIARLMLELLKNLEGDDARLVPKLIQVLVHAKLLVETSILEAEPDLEALVKTPGVMMGEPHVTFPRILAVLWLTVTDPGTTKKLGWCPINKMNKYITISKSMNVAKHMRTLEPVVARARFIIEEFIQNVTPLNMYSKKASEETDPALKATRTKPSRTITNTLKPVKRPGRYYINDKLDRIDPVKLVEEIRTTVTSEPDMDAIPRIVEGNQDVTSTAPTSLYFLISLNVVLYCLH